MLLLNSRKNAIDKRIYDYEHKYIKKNNKNIKKFIRDIPRHYNYKKIRVNNINDDKVKSILRIEKPDVVFVFGTAIIKQNILEENKQTRFINIHFSFLPKYRGAKPEFWAFYNCEYDCVGVTIHLLEKKIDSGPILCQKKTTLDFKDNYITARFKNIVTLNSLLEENFNKIIYNEILPIKQKKEKLYQYCEFSKEKNLFYWEKYNQK